MWSLLKIQASGDNKSDHVFVECYLSSVWSKLRAPECSRLAHDPHYQLCVSTVGHGYAYTVAIGTNRHAHLGIHWVNTDPIDRCGAAAQAHSYVMTGITIVNCTHVHSVDDILKFRWSNLRIVGVDRYTAITDKVKGRIGVTMEFVAKVEDCIFPEFRDGTGVDEVDRNSH